ncbi:MAG: hypothetical protein Aurels2KO_28880 [Aureliella sp.]
MTNQDGLLQAGDRLGAYSVQRKLGSGGMADVYFAIHQELDRPAALKVLRASLAADETHLQRFMQEARAAAALIHPNIVQVYDVGREGERRYIAQEYVAGSNLRDYLAAGQETSVEPRPLPTIPLEEMSQATPSGGSDSAGVEPTLADRQLDVREVLSILLQVLAALNKSATSGIVHRDIKPENIMLTPEGEAKVADFGLARVLLGDDPNLTRAGTTLGTPMYMSPEQIQDGKVDIRSDLYSLGVTLFHMLAGQPPFSGESPLAIAMQHVSAEIPSVEDIRKDVPDTLSELTRRLLAKSPDDRFASPAEVIDYLQGGRKADLAEYWPDQSVPLPGVLSSTSKGPLRETLALQAIVRRQRSAARRNWVAGALMIACLCGLFICGYALARRPALLSNLPDTPVDAVARQNTAREQYDAAYKAALLNSDFGLENWQAVGKYFGKEKDDSSRYWGGLARLQIARQLEEDGETDRARRELDRMIAEWESEPEYFKKVLAMAYLLLADVSDDPTQGINAAAKICASIGEKDRQDVDRYAEALSLEVGDSWNSR